MSCFWIWNFRTRNKSLTRCHSCYHTMFRSLFLIVSWLDKSPWNEINSKSEIEFNFNCWIFHRSRNPFSSTTACNQLESIQLILFLMTRLFYNEVLLRSWLFHSVKNFKYPFESRRNDIIRLRGKDLRLDEAKVRFYTCL